MRLKYFALGIIALLVACTQPQVPADYTDAGKPAPIYPDYIGVTIPINMAPLHFQLMQPADEVVCRFTVGNEQLVCEGPKVMPSIDDWRPLAEAAKGGSISVEVFACQNDKWQRYKPFEVYVSPDSIDPWLSYRLISPSYVTYEELTINQRCLENYDERVIYDNILCSTEKNGQCINCHK